MGVQFGVDFDQEGDDYVVVHVHFDNECPVCHTQHAGTTMYSSVSDTVEDDRLFECESCSTEFKILKYSCANTPEALIEVVSEL